MIGSGNDKVRGRRGAQTVYCSGIGARRIRRSKAALNGTTSAVRPNIAEKMRRRGKIARLGGSDAQRTQ